MRVDDLCRLSQAAARDCYLSGEEPVWDRVLMPAPRRPRESLAVLLAAPRADSAYLQRLQALPGCRDDARVVRGKWEGFSAGFRLPRSGIKRRACRRSWATTPWEGVGCD